MPTPTGPEVLGLYDLLLAVWPSPVVALNRAVAVAMVQGPAAGLAALEEVADDRLVLCAELVGSRRIWAAQVGCLVDPDGSRRHLSDRLDDQASQAAQQSAGPRRTHVPSR